MRNDLSWQIELREHGIHLIGTFDRLLASIDNESTLAQQIRACISMEKMTLFDCESLPVGFELDERDQTDTNQRIRFDV
jgi:hypothetical protein